MIIEPRDRLFTDESTATRGCYYDVYEEFCDTIMNFEKTRWPKEVMSYTNGEEYNTSPNKPPYGFLMGGGGERRGRN